MTTKEKQGFGLYFLLAFGLAWLCQVGGCMALLQKQKELREEALRKAALYDQVIFVGGLNHQQDLEGQDRPDMKLPYAQDQLILELLKAKPDTVVVMVAGSPVEMGAWLSRAKALVWNWYAGFIRSSMLLH